MVGGSKPERRCPVMGKANEGTRTTAVSLKYKAPLVTSASPFSLSKLSLSARISQSGSQLGPGLRGQVV